ncbi:hypothetical protein [Glaciihabitans sp. dw_435]|uniref:hypothetical protein n=1 Tax=Glaciihabitans sp. dw_435 TaxID=2720081 RepID=UPI001BD22B87|nr:hypothetical protein [Glaciihabitans sp. dw_435]
MNGFAIAIALVLFVGGIALFGFAFQVPDFKALVFFAGIVAIVISIAIPFHFLKRTDA